MSFQDIFHGPRAGLPPPPPPPPPQTVVAHAVFQINTKVAALWHLADALASCRGDARAIRERIRRTRAEVTRLARNTARKLAGPDAAADVWPKLARDFEAVLRDFQRVQQQIIAADRQETAAASAAFLVPFFSPPPAPRDAYPARSKPNYGAGRGTWDDHQQCNIQLQQQQLVESRRTQDLIMLDNEITFNEALVQEREREICKIQQEITEINEIFRDLATLVHDQHEAIDIVECNLGAAAAETDQTKERLTKAAKMQQTSSDTDCMLLVAIGLVVFIFVLLFSL